MGSTDADHTRSPQETARPDRTNRSLFATATLISVTALFACWFGTREIINEIVNYEGREAATHWAEAFAHTLEDQNADHAGGPIQPYSNAVKPEKFRALDNAIFDGKITAYRIYNPQGVIVATSKFLEIGNNAGTPGMRQAILEGSTSSHLMTTDTAETVSRAVAPLIWVGDLIGAIQIDVDVSARAAQLNRLRYLAFAALVGLLAAVMATLGFVAARTLRHHKAAKEELTRNVRQHRRLLDEAPDSIVIHNLKQVLYANTVAAALHGASSPDDLIGIDPTKLVPDDQNDKVRDHRHKALREGKIMRTESVGRRRLYESVVETDTMGIPIEWNGDPCILIQSRDMSKRRAHQRQTAEREA